MTSASSRVFPLARRAAGVSFAAVASSFLFDDELTREKWSGPCKVNALRTVSEPFAWYTSTRDLLSPLKTRCDGRIGGPGDQNSDTDSSKEQVNTQVYEADEFPNLSRHGKHSLLRQYLTEEVYNELKNKRTVNGVKLDDIIQAGVSLPWGAHPPRGIAGVFCGDAESYDEFELLLSPLIQVHHNAAFRSRLRRHVTNLDFKRLTQEKVDPAGEYILYTRMRLARSLTGFRFAPCISRRERRRVEALIKDCTQDFPYPGKYVSIMEMTNAQHDDLLQRKIVFPDPDDFTLAAGLGRDWPDGRGLYCDVWDADSPSLMIWCNARDHVHIISNAKGGDVQGVFTRLSKAVMALESSLKERGHFFVEHQRLGFVNTSPADIGTALRASVYVKLVRLGQQPGFNYLLDKLRLEARPFKANDTRYTGIFDIANAEALGKTEVELINIMIRGVGILIELEKRLENGETLSYEDIISAS